MISEDESSDVKETGKNSKRNKPKRKIVSIFFNLPNSTLYSMFKNYEALTRTPDMTLVII